MPPARLKAGEGEERERLIRALTRGWEDAARDLILAERERAAEELEADNRVARGASMCALKMCPRLETLSKEKRPPRCSHIGFGLLGAGPPGERVWRER